MCKSLIFLTFSEAELDSLSKFCRDVGWEMIFDLNLLNRKNGEWNSTNAESLLRYAAIKGYKFNVELGNGKEGYEHFANRHHLNKSLNHIDMGLIMHRIITNVFRLKKISDINSPQ